MTKGLKVLAAAVVLGTMSMAPAAQASVFDFQALATGNEGGWASRTGVGTRLSALCWK